MAQYSDLFEDLETLACFLLFHEISEKLRNMRRSVHSAGRVLGHPTQSPPIKRSDREYSANNWSKMSHHNKFCIPICFIRQLIEYCNGCEINKS